VTPLRDFLYETFTNPSPKDITAELIDSMFLDWGNEKKLAGKNWWTDAARVIEYAGRKWPQKWPSLSFSSRSARKIKKRQCVEVGGRLHKSKEGAGRSTPKDIVEKISAIIKQAPDPIPLIFLLAISTGARRDDLHAIQYDCLFPDEDPNFMQLRFWQNKVRKWNIKPLLISDPAHKRYDKNSTGPYRLIDWQKNTSLISKILWRKGILRISIIHHHGDQVLMHKKQNS